jgi:3'-phosphoadenosine 5'-phosphosulfate sulfotransferase (PAPS reductase)/FAD synthetase
VAVWKTCVYSLSIRISPVCQHRTEDFWSASIEKSVPYFSIYGLGDYNRSGARNIFSSGGCRNCVNCNETGACRGGSRLKMS